MSRPVLTALTGFDAFGGDAINPSWEAVRRLPPLVGRLRVVTAQLPTSFARAARRLRARIVREQPDVVLCVGLAADRAMLTLERVAINLRHARIADNDGARPHDRPVIAGAPVAYFSTLPVRKILAALEREGLRAEMSMSAGTFVCNHVFYALMHQLAQGGNSRNAPLAGFVHVPTLQDEFPDVALQQMVQALETILRVCGRNRRG